MAIKLRAVQKKLPIIGPESIAPTMQQILKRENKLARNHEHFWVVGLCNKNKILFIELIGMGQQNRVAVHPPDVFRMAVYKLATKIILVHNHPSGELIPSTADRNATDRILKVGEIINIEVLDHIIISETSFVSFDKVGIMAELKKSDTWRLIAKEEIEVKQMKEDILLERAMNTRSIQIAKKLKEGGMDDAMIKKYTGLSVREIKKL